MKFLPRTFNDLFALVSLLVLIAFDVWLIRYSEAEKEIVTFVLGAEFGWLGLIYTFFYRKAPEAGQ